MLKKECLKPNVDASEFIPRVAGLGLLIECINMMQRLMSSRGGCMKGKNPFNICIRNGQSDCADCAIQDELACRRGRKIMNGLHASIKSGALHSLTPTSRRFFGYCSLLAPVRSTSAHGHQLQQKTRDSWFGFSHLRHLPGHSVIFITDEINGRLRLISPNNTFHI